MLDRDESDGADLRHRLRYRFDNLLARGTVATLASLGIVTAIAVLVSSLLLTAFGVTFDGSDDSRWLEDFWQSMLRMMDPGTMAGDVGWGRRLLALAVTVFGLLVAGTLIGILANGVENRVDAMRRGRSVVIESDHLVVLGGTERLPMVIRQLVLANQGRPDRTVVVLADRDPAELHEMVRDHVRGLQGTRVVYRCGDPTRRTDVELVRPARASGIIVLADRDSDAAAVQTVLAIASELGEPHEVPVVVEVSDRRTAARLVRACPGVHPVVPHEAMARSAALALRQRGLGHVLAELSDAGRSTNIHVIDCPDAIGLRFEQLLHRYENGIPIGRHGADGSIELNPPPDRTLVPGDRLVVIASGVGPLEPTNATRELRGARSPTAAIAAGPDADHLVVVGWNALAPQLLEDWAVAASSSSTVEILHDEELIDATELSVPDLGVPTLTTRLNDLSDVLAGGRATTVIVLGSWALDVVEADARTLLDVRALRRLARERGDKVPRFVVELRDPENVELLDLDGPDDYVISTAIAGHFLAQLVEQPDRRRVLLEMYDSSGPSLQLIRCERLGLDGHHEFSDIAATAYADGVIAIGWRTAAERGARLVLGPPQSHDVALQPGDEIVVVG